MFKKLEILDDYVKRVVNKEHKVLHRSAEKDWRTQVMKKLLVKQNATHFAMVPWKPNTRTNILNL